MTSDTNIGANGGGAQQQTAGNAADEKAHSQKTTSGNGSSENKLQLPPELEQKLRRQGAGPADEFILFIAAALEKVDEDSVVKACLDDKYVGCSIYELVKAKGGKEYVMRTVEKILNAPIWPRPKKPIKLEYRG